MKGIDGTIDWSFFSQRLTVTAVIKGLDEGIMFKEINASLFSVKPDGQLGAVNEGRL